VEEAKTRLREVTQLTLQVLAEQEEPSSIEVKPREGLFRPPIRVDGWVVSWRGDSAVVCPDGRLFISVRFAGYRHTNFEEIIESRLNEVGAFTGDSGFSLRDRAFGSGGDAGATASLRGELERVRNEMVRDLSRILSDRGLSL
jgi:hypothetical protein